MRRISHLALLLAVLPAVGCSGAAGDGDVPGGDAAQDAPPGDGFAIDSGATRDAPADGTATEAGEGGEGGVDCPGVGVRCGASLGLDPTKLYQCKEGAVAGVARDCKGTCLTATDGTQDTCPCPDGDGRYCGERVSGDKNKLYDCKAGRITEAAQCAPTCTAGTGPTADKCAPCSSGNGAYCGASAGADPNTLYTCTDGVLTVKQNCGGACVVKPPGTPDTCGPCPSGDGLYCGGPVGLDPNTLYDCKGGLFTVNQKCGTTCYVAPSGTSDYCTGTTTGGGLLCANVQWWNSALTYGPYMSYGWWDTDLAISTHTKIQLRHDSKLYKEGVYGWGWMPEFVDQVTGEKFRFLHLQPTAKYTTSIGTVYPAGTIVGLSGGDSAETGLGTYSTGAHLCVQTLDAYRTVFPTGKDPCK